MRKRVEVEANGGTWATGWSWS